MEVPAELTSGHGVAGFGVLPKPDFRIRGGGANVPPVHFAFPVAIGIAASFRLGPSSV